MKARSAVSVVDSIVLVGEQVLARDWDQRDVTRFCAFGVSPPDRRDLTGGGQPKGVRSRTLTFTSLARRDTQRPSHRALFF
jgi:hypothetical protein